MAKDLEKLRKKAERYIGKATGSRDDGRVQYMTGANRLKEVGDDPRARRLANVEASAREKLKARFGKLREEVEETTATWAEAPRPQEDTLREKLDETYQEAVSDAGSIIKDRRVALEKAREDYIDDLPDFSAESTPALESEVRQHLRSLDPEDKREELRRIAEEGTDTERAAVLNTDLSPGMAGLRDKDHRDHIRKQAYKAEAGEALQSMESLGTAAEALDKELDRFEAKAAKMVGRMPMIGQQQEE